MAEKLRIPSHFQDGMILQQQIPFVFYGQSLPGVRISVLLNRNPSDGRVVSPLDRHYGSVFHETVTADQAGRFQVDLPAFEASFDSFVLTITCENETIELKDILFGEVWVAAGQSNMEMPLGAVQSSEETAKIANLPYVRVLSHSAGWLRGDQSREMETVSAVGFSFARKLHLDLDLPVGLIEMAFGNSHIHSWISRSSILKNEKIRQHLVAHGFYQNDVLSDSLNQPSVLYHNKLAPLQSLAARGVLWYQGESDYLYPNYYQEALKTLISDWNLVFRSAGEEGLAFLMVQLAPYFYGHQDFTRLSEFNEMLASVHHTLTCPSALLPLYDLPLDYENAPEKWRHPIHPTAKLPVGQRLALMASGLLYHRKAPQSAPECSGIEMVGNKMLLSFDHIGDGLRLSDSGDRLRGFTLCGPDRVFVEANARILYGVRVMVWHDQIREPQAVTYAFSDLNQDANLISRDYLPVVPFRSDRFRSKYCPPMEWTHCDSLCGWFSPDACDIFQTGWHPRWRITSGEGQLFVEPNNKIKEDGSLFFRYRTHENEGIALEPQLQYASLFPPLDLSDYEAIHVAVFNPDQHEKSMRLALVVGASDATLREQGAPQLIGPVLNWQTITFNFNEPADQLSKTYRLLLLIDDIKMSGELYLGRVSLIRPQ
ncbi:MAG: hypothetical protein KBG64_08340 [Clostridia bacterium]|nr:hypothetical protein [Clostridia bacterium]